LPECAAAVTLCSARVLLLLLRQARRAEEAKLVAEEKKKRDRDNATKRVAGTWRHAQPACLLAHLILPGPGCVFWC
jgi:hypothetical protein